MMKCRLLAEEINTAPGIVCTQHVGLKLVKIEGVKPPHREVLLSAEVPSPPHDTNERKSWSAREKHPINLLLS